MNTRIALRLNKAIKQQGNKLINTASDIIFAHNKAILNGFIESLQLRFIDATSDEKYITVTVTPKCNFANFKDLYILQSLWGANDLFVTNDNENLVFILQFNIQ